MTVQFVPAFAPQLLPFASFINVAAAGAVAGFIATGSVEGALVGAFSAAVFHGIGQGFANLPADSALRGSFLGTNLNAGGLALKSLAHAATGGVLSSVQGGKFVHGFTAAGVTQFASGGIDLIDPSTSFSPVRIAAAAILGGTVSEISGGKFANGAVTGAFSRAFNDELDKFVKGIAPLKKEQAIVRAADALDEDDFRTLFPSYAADVDSLGLSIAKLKLFTDFNEELLSGRLLDVAKQGNEVLKENARRQVLRSAGIAGKSNQVTGRALGLSDSQIGLLADINSVRAGLGRANATAGRLAKLAEEIRSVSEVGGD